MDKYGELLALNPGELQMIVGMDTAAGHMALAAVTDCPEHQTPSLFNGALVFVRLEISKPEQPDSEQTEQVFIMEPSHAIERGMALVRAGAAAMNVTPPTEAELETIGVEARLKAATE